MTKLSGFPELLPQQRNVEKQVLDRLARAFELHGFANIETRAVEPLEQLLSKGETSKEVYVLRRLQAEDGADSGMGLHFDLTVPLARYVVENAGKLNFPFRRYQMQKVWRGERPQEGRYREFTQVDIDIVGRDALAFHHDVEVARVMVEALSTLEFLPGFDLQVNNRKLIQGFYAGLGITDPTRTMQLIDKLDKVAPERVRELLIQDAALAPEVADLCLALAQISATDDSFVAQVQALGVTHPLLEEGLSELAEVIRGCQSVVGDRVGVRAELAIARGLDYYTGTVFETRLRGYESLGSICSGGRYDSLATDGRTTFPGVGISFGLSRVLVPLLAAEVVVASRAVPSACLIAVNDEESRSQADVVAQGLRARGISCEVSSSAAKFGKQIRQAERRGIPYVWFTSATEHGAVEHHVKDIRTGAQTSADPGQWSPPLDDQFVTITAESETPQ